MDRREFAALVAGFAGVFGGGARASRGPELRLPVLQSGVFPPQPAKAGGNDGPGVAPLRRRDAEGG